MPLGDGQHRAAPVGPIVSTRLQDDARRNAVLRQEDAELRCDAVQTVEVLRAGAKMSGERRRVEVELPQDLPDVV